MAIDSHMHINSLVFRDFDEPIKKVNNDPNIDAVINVGMNIQTSIEAIEIANNNPKFYATVGIHPLYLEGQNFYELEKLAMNEKVVAIGEIGFDDKFKTYDKQKLYLILQIRLANELGLPVIIHSSNSNMKVIDVFETYGFPEHGCVFHCFQPEKDFLILDYLISHNIYISFAGKITKHNAKRSIEVAKAVPNNLFLVETDSPFIPVEPTGNLISSSSDINYIIQKLAEVKGYSYKDIEQITYENTRRLFRKIK